MNTAIMTGSDLAAWRNGRSRTQDQMARRVGVTRESISLWERKHADDVLAMVIRKNNFHRLAAHINASSPRTGGA